MKRLFVIIAFLVLAYLWTAPTNTAAIADQSGCPDPGNPKGRYGAGSTDGRGICQINGSWANFTPTPAVAASYQKGTKFPGVTKVGDITFYLEGEPPRDADSTGLTFHPELAAKRIVELGYPGPYELHVVFSRRVNTLCTNFACFDSKGLLPKASVYLWTDLTEKEKQTVSDVYKTSGQLYSGLLNFELGRIKCQQVDRRKDLCGESDPWLNQWAWKTSPYPYFTP